MNDTTTPISYDRSQITHWLDARTVAKAVGYVGAVSGMRWQGGGCLTARVQGTQRAPYAVNLVFIRSRSGIELHDACTCPVGYRCKHVGAVLLANLQSTIQPD